MLILNRRIGESIVIDGRITVTLLTDRRGRICLGVTAPDNVRVWRKEIEPEPPQPLVTEPAD